MRKISVIIMAVTMAITIAAVAIAATTITSTTPIQVAGAPFTPSLNVMISAASTTDHYVATSAHQMAASGPGYEFMIQDTFNGMLKKAWANQALTAWPDTVSLTTTTAGFQ